MANKNNQQKMALRLFFFFFFSFFRKTENEKNDVRSDRETKKDRSQFSLSTSSFERLLLISCFSLYYCSTT